MSIRPQPGFQTMALSTSADIAILGGSAGCGKTFTLLLEPMRHFTNAGFGGVIFRRTTPQITNEGGLWDTSLSLYPHLQGVPIESRHKWKLPSGASMRFAHLEYDKDVNAWQGSQVPFIGFDELTHFTKKQFFYMLSRNRSACGVRPYVRATCNPDPDSWVATFIEWWIDQTTGLPIPERAGVLRYFTQDKDSYVWGDTFEEVAEKCKHIFNDPELKATGVNPRDLVKSVTFIPGSIKKDNKIFISKDPGYLGNLLSLGDEEKAQLLDGNWKVRIDGLSLFDFYLSKNIFSNTGVRESAGRNPIRCITCDAARFGRDFCVIYVWRGWEVIHVSVFKKSDVHDIVNHIEQLRGKFNVMRSDVVVDQDGVGDGSVKLGNYTGFHGGASPMKDPDSKVQEKSYKNLKTQCAYRVAQRVNDGEVLMNVTRENVWIYDDSSLKTKEGHMKLELSTKVSLGGGKTADIKELILDDLRAIKRAKTDQENKLQINTKDEQKNILNGRSPDFFDTLNMREFVELRPRPKTATLVNPV